MIWGKWIHLNKKLLWFRNKTPETLILESLRKYYQTISSSLPRLDWTARILSVIFYNFFQFLHPFIILKRKNKSLQIFVILLLNFLIVISLTAFATVCNIKYCTSYWHKLRKVHMKEDKFLGWYFPGLFPAVAYVFNPDIAEQFNQPLYLVRNVETSEEKERANFSQVFTIWWCIGPSLST